MFTKPFHSGKQGFTLIELLVVIAIIGILSSVVLASLNSAREKSRDARRVSDIKQLQLALELYFDDNGTYPGGDETLGGGAGSWERLTVDGHIAIIPTGPNADVYQYQAYDNRAALVGNRCAVAATNCTFYHLGGLLENNVSAALDGDVDAETDTGAIDGLSTLVACAAEAGVTTVDDRCYDVRP